MHTLSSPTSSSAPVVPIPMTLPPTQRGLKRVSRPLTHIPVDCDLDEVVVKMADASASSRASNVDALTGSKFNCAMALRRSCKCLSQRQAQ